MQYRVASVGLIQDAGEAPARWLTRWSPVWSCYRLPGDAKRDDETFRRCLLRSLVEELQIREGRDFLAASGPTAHLDFTVSAPSGQDETRYIVELFFVQLRGSETRRKIEAAPETRWATDEEIRAHQFADGAPISTTANLFLRKADLMA